VAQRLFTLSSCEELAVRLLQRSASLADTDIQKIRRKHLGVWDFSPDETAQGQGGNPELQGLKPFLARLERPS